MSESSQLLNVHIHNADVLLYQGEATAVSSINTTGKFDVIPFHSNFISIIKDTVVIQLSSGEKKEITIDRGILKVSENKVDVLLGIIV